MPASRKTQQAKIAKAVKSTKPAKPAKRPAKSTGQGKPAHKAVPKADGDKAVQDFIGLLPGWQAEAGRRIDRLFTREVAGVRKAIKWHSAMYGVDGQGWIASVGGFKSYVKVNFFAGAQLKPQLPGGEGKTMRFVDYPSVEAIDEARLGAWIRQAATLPGWGKV
jgi:hypothetical protein